MLIIITETKKPVKGNMLGAIVAVKMLVMKEVKVVSSSRPLKSIVPLKKRERYMTGRNCVAFPNKIYKYMKLLRATQFHMLGLEIVSHYVAFIYEIRSHFKFLFFKVIINFIYIYIYFNNHFKKRHNFICLVWKLCRTMSHLYMKLGRVRHNFVFACEAISATQLRFPVDRHFQNQK